VSQPIDHELERISIGIGVALVPTLDLDGDRGFECGGPAASISAKRGAGRWFSRGEYEDMKRRTAIFAGSGERSAEIGRRYPIFQPISGPHWRHDRCAVHLA
jgi:hypothetical protein